MKRIHDYWHCLRSAWVAGLAKFAKERDLQRRKERTAHLDLPF